MRLRFPAKLSYFLYASSLICPGFYLSKSILSNGLKSLLNIDCLLGARLKVRDLVLGMTPLLGALGGHGPVIEVHLVAQHNEGEVIRVPGTGLEIILVKLLRIVGAQLSPG